MDLKDEYLSIDRPQPSTGQSPCTGFSPGRYKVVQSWDAREQRSSMAPLRSSSDTTRSEIIVIARRPRSGITRDRMSRRSVFVSSSGRSFPRVLTFQSLRSRTHSSLYCCNLFLVRRARYPRALLSTALTSAAGLRRLLSRWTSDFSSRSYGSRLIASSSSAGSLLGRPFSRNLAQDWK